MEINNQNTLGAILINMDIDILNEKSIKYNSVIDSMFGELEKYILANPNLTPNQKIHIKIRKERLEIIEDYNQFMAQTIKKMCETSQKPPTANTTNQILINENNHLKKQNDLLKKTIEMFGIDHKITKFAIPDHKEYLRMQSIQSAYLDFNL